MYENAPLPPTCTPDPLFRFLMGFVAGPAPLGGGVGP